MYIYIHIYVYVVYYIRMHVQCTHMYIYVREYTPGRLVYILDYIDIHLFI